VMLRTIRGLIQSIHLRLIAGKMLLIGGLALAVAQLPFVGALDIAAVDSLRDHGTHLLTAIALGVTELASTGVILPLAAGAVVVLAALRHWRGAVALAVSVLATQGVVSLGKALMSRPRPDEHATAVDPSGFSFPSAHSASAVALYVMLAVIAGSALRRRISAPAWAGAIGLVAMIGFSRVYLGAHYPSDVLAGWLTGGIVVIASWALLRPSAGAAGRGGGLAVSECRPVFATPVGGESADPGVSSKRGHAGAPRARQD
jgi:membrane-associated phospholipid phosphatase